MRKVIAMARESRRKREERRFGRPERLADKILEVERLTDWTLPGFALDNWGKLHAEVYEKSIDRIKVALESCPVIAAPNACDVYWQHPQDFWDYKDDYPNLAPPFPEFFIESTHPGKIVVHGGKHVIPASWCPSQWGFHIRAHDVDGKTEEFPTFSTTGELSPIFLPDARWYLEFMLVYVHLGKLCFYPLIGMLPVSRSGQALLYPTVLMSGVCASDAERKEIWSFADCLLKPILFAITFMHCKNVVTQVVEPDPTLNRQRKKHGFRPFVRYHTIDIEPMRKVLRTEGQVDTVGLKKALHICRGHFASYDDEKPLFGKYTGQFWRPSHVRGSAKQGVVVSDYEVGAPGGGK